MAFFVSHLFHFCLSLFLLPPSSGQPLSGATLIKDVCSHIPNFSFRSHTLSFDPFTKSPQALAGELAITALRLSQAKAIELGSFITKLLTHTSSVPERKLLKACKDYNRLAVSQLSAANNEFNFEFIDVAVEEINTAAKTTQQCKYEGST